MTFEGENATAAYSTLLPSPWFGLGTTDQSWPSQCSTRVWNHGTEYEPTAHTSSVARTVTSQRKFSSVPTSIVGSIVHTCPSQCSASERRGWPGVASWNPTAHTSLVARASTDMKTFSPVPAFGVGITFHLLPFQCWASVRNVVPSS